MSLAGSRYSSRGVHDLMARLCDLDRTVLLETSGACDISSCDERVIRIVDLKTPGSGEVSRNLMSNLDLLTRRDEIKFVICDRADYEWSRDLAHEHQLFDRCSVLFSAVFEQPAGEEIEGRPGLPLAELAKWILADRLPVRLQPQLHKWIWHPQARGV